MSRRALRWVTVVAALPLLLLALSTATLAMRCCALGVVVASCCCPATAGADTPDRAPAPPALRRAACCDLEAQAPQTPDAERPHELRSVGGDLVPDAAGPAPLADRGPEARRLRLPRADRAPPPRPSILLTKRSLLI
jgi:hypothetical protein